MFTVKIQGLESVLKKIERYDKALGEGVINELSQGAKNIAAVAKVNAPTGKTGALAASGGFDISQPYRKSIFFTAPYAPYVEFGTGSKVFQSVNGFAFTPEMKDFAREFYVNGMGRMPARPYLFPAYSAEIVQIRKRIRNLFFGK